MTKLTAEEVKALKGRGFLRNKDTDCFSARVITKNGVLTTRQASVLAQAAEQFGDGRLALTTRLTVELTGIPYEKIEAFCDFIGKEGLVPGGTGARVRPVVACKGTVCVHGLYDTQAFAEEIHNTYYVGWYDVKLPHKFKIAVGGCPNNCVKPSLNDFGIVGQRVPLFDAAGCKGCKKCPPQNVCPVGAFSREDDHMVLDGERCVHCGKCVDICNFGCITEKASGYRVYIGGKWGKFSRAGTPVPGVFSKEQVFSMIEKALLLYREHGYAGERLGDMVDRIGEEAVMRELLSDEILTRKEEILAAPLCTRG